MHVLLATDADWVIDEVTAALGGPDTSFTVCREGRLVSDLVEHGNVDVVITDLQIGSMGGMAVAMALRLDASVGSVPLVPIVMLLDRAADVYLAQRSGAESWLIKPLDALRLRRAVNAAVAGESYTEGMPVEVVSEVEAESADGDTAEVAESTEPETVDAG
ncbi:MAG: response regulator [Ilumatobacteraceae bacterium]|jgi:DNA-binding response OmpR family regulator